MRSTGADASAAQKAVVGERPKAYRVYLLAGLVHCAVCGRRMNGQARVSRARTWRYYVCRSFDTKSARADEVEHALLDAVTTMRLPERSIEAARQELLNRLNVPSKPAASNLRARLQQRLTRLLQLYSW